MKGKSAMQNNDIFHSDAPINNPEQDLFERNEFVSSLTKKIIEFKAKNSLVIALHGPWGSGKTSVLNLIDKSLSSEKNLKILNFDPWYFNSQEQLIQTFLYTILGEAIKAVSKDQSSFKQNLDLYGLSIASAFSASPKIEAMGIGLDMGAFKPLQDLKEPSSVKEKLKKHLVNKEFRFVILIDNLDRLEPTELLLMFKLVKLCADFPNFVYVLAFDHEQAEKILKKQNVDSEFLAKIIQVDIELPNIDQEEIDDFVLKNLQEIATGHNIFIDERSWKRFQDTYRLAVSGILIDDLRKAKRFINSVSFSFSLVKSGVNLADFLLLEILRVFNPQVYNLLPYYKKVLTDFRITETSMRPFSIFRKKISSSADIILKSVFEGIVGALFPPFRQFCDTPGEERSVEFYERYTVEQRICVVNFFDGFFQFRIPREETSISNINVLLDRINHGVIDHSELIDFFRKSKESGNLAFVLARFELICRFDNDEARKILIDAIADTSSMLNWGAKWTTSNTFGSEGDLAVRLAIKIFDDFENKEKVLNSFIQSASLPIATFVGSVLAFGKIPTRRNDPWPRRIDDYDYLEWPQVQPVQYAISALQHRILNELFKEDNNIFIEHPDTYKDILKIWMGNYAEPDKKIIQSYVYRQNIKDVRVLPRLLYIFMKEGIDSFSRNRESLDKDVFLSWFDVQKLWNDYKTFLNSEEYQQLPFDEKELLKHIETIAAEPTQSTPPDVPDWLSQIQSSNKQ